MWDGIGTLFTAITESVLGDKNKGWQDEFRCPYLLCPSNTDEKGKPSPGYLKARMKFVQKTSPRVYMYRCKDCSCLINKSVEIAPDGREIWRINPALNSPDQPSFMNMGVLARWK